MFKVIQARLKQKYRTIPFPAKNLELPERVKGAPVICREKCRTECRDCEKVCPTGAIFTDQAGINIDLGKCLFCNDCHLACSSSAINFSRDYRLAAFKRNDLILKEEKTLQLAEDFDKKIHRLFGRSLKLRQVSAGGCNGCEADINVLTTVVFDLGRFGIGFVASPRHADGLLVTGPVTKNMELALEKTYEAVAFPKVVIAVGACAISGGLYRGHEEVNNGVDAIIPIDLYIPGCPPHPFTILDGLLRLVGRKELALSK